MTSEQAAQARDRLRVETPDQRLARLRGEWDEALRRLPPGVQVQTPGSEDAARTRALVTILQRAGVIDDVAFEHEFKRALGDLLQEAIVQVREVASQLARQQLVAPPAHARIPTDLRAR